jgi:hypothetical protein
MDGVTYVCGQDVKAKKYIKDTMTVQKTYFYVVAREKSGNAE